MPISAQEVIVCNQWERLGGIIEVGEARLEENDLAKMGPEWEDETEYWLGQRKLGAELHEVCKKYNKYVALKIQEIEPNNCMLSEWRRGEMDVCI